jgi:phosphate transport system protein
MLGNKDREFTQISNDLQILSAKVIDQFTLTGALLESGWEDTLYGKIMENEKKISYAKAILLEKIPQTAVLFSPKATDLRKLVACHDVTLLIEEIDDFLLSIVCSLKKLNLSDADYSNFKWTMKNRLHSLKESANAAIYSFIRENASEALRMVGKDTGIQPFSTEITEDIVAFFQEIPLSGQQVLNIISLNKMAYILDKIESCIVNIAKSTIYATEGTNIRHQLPQS